MPWRRRARARDEWPAGDLGHVIERAASYAEQLQATFSSYPGMEGIDVHLGSTRAGAAREVHLSAVLIRWSAGGPVVLDHAEPLMRRPDPGSPWQLVATAEEARNRLRAVLGSWAADT
jgi:hypothetical protein